MSDTKGLNNRLDYVERKRLELEQQVKDLTQQRDNARADANHWRKVDRELADQIDRIGAGLRDIHAAAVKASEEQPGEARLASRVQMTAAALKLFFSITTEGDDRG
jgi:uncharacterized coiled-coil DUF342 family protein